MIRLDGVVARDTASTAWKARWESKSQRSPLTIDAPMTYDPRPMTTTGKILARPSLEEHVKGILAGTSTTQKHNSSLIAKDSRLFGKMVCLCLLCMLEPRACACSRPDANTCAPSARLQAQQGEVRGRHDQAVPAYGKAGARAKFSTPGIKPSNPPTRFGFRSAS